MMYMDDDLRRTARVTGMDELIAFVTARLDEDEAAGKAAASVAGPGWKAEAYYPPDESRTRTCLRSEGGAFLADFDDAPDYPELAAHIARHDPARVLREVAAKRAIVGDENEGLAMIAVHERGTWPDELTREADRILRQLAAVWSGHPDYRPEWKP